ncbi:hypothetical protein [Rubellicoccus peritrichatus]|uniref:F5/8 type C domain-containing protein n=1 Tax=Rubellicoccus peritrichatus TaxID=3080537 RepID=A0AAQ3QR83_9BACT|nr:hypothetical protein [Puniceicoccus sp. CR14]WOO41048.1 hypothetical protein RZN69_20705 [Puniceicoccus sp. CR14]
MNSASSIRPGGYNMADETVTKASDVKPKLGSTALRFSGLAKHQVAKGHFGVGCNPGNASKISYWLYLEDNANVKSVGLQVYDAKGESMLALTEEIFPGWQKLTFDINDENFEQAYAQKDHNKLLDFPLKSADIIWWAKDVGESSIVVDDMRLVKKIEVSDTAKGSPVLDVDVVSPIELELGDKLNLDLVIKNYNDRDTDYSIYSTLQVDSANVDVLEPHHEHGFDHALKAHSKTYADGKIIATDTLVDGTELTSAVTPYKKDYWTEFDQTVELDSVRNVTAMKWRSGQADKVWKVDVLASLDGESFSPVEGLQDVDMYRKWSFNWFPEFEPFEAKFIKFHYHTDTPRNLMAAPSRIIIFDGPENDTYTIPEVGELLAETRETVSVESLSSTLVSIPVSAAMQSGSYLLSVLIDDGAQEIMKFRHIYVEPDPVFEITKEKSRIGMNSASTKYIDSLKKVGIGWIRFENSKWAFCNPEPGRFAFDGSVKPWQVDFDAIFKDYHDAGFGIIPLTIVTPVHASNAPESVKEVRDIGGYPPRDYDGYEEYMFQLTARYGKDKVPEERLLTEDKVSGLGYIDHYEIWNEPNLNPKVGDKVPTWGPWRGTLDEFWPLFRKGYDGVVDAYPEAIISSPGMAGATSEMMHVLYEYQYPDGKRPIDFCDIFNVHYYSGPEDPETAGDDFNSGEALSAGFPELMRQLSAWRDQYRPSAEVWLTETGYDTGGPIASTERKQAAKLVRIIMLALQNGVDKVFVYRESGSTPTKHASAGIHRNDGSRKASWFTLATMTRQIYDAEPLGMLESEDPFVYIYAWKREDGGVLITAWTLEGTVKLGVDFGKAKVTDAFGYQFDVDSTNDLTLTDYPLYINLDNGAAQMNEVMHEAAAIKAADTEKRELMAKANTYLYDFGDPSTVTYYNFGKIRSMKPVANDMMYDEDRGYGFQVPAQRNEFKHYVSRKHVATKHHVLFAPDTVFQFEVEPGTYQIQFNGASLRGNERPEDLIIEPQGGEAVQIPLEINNRIADKATFTTSGGPVLVKATGKVELRWINVVPVID